MIRILFYYDNYCSNLSRGGTEVATVRIARALKAKGECAIFLAYRHNGPIEGEEAEVFASSVKLSKRNERFEATLADFIRSREIDVIVNMGRFFRHPLLQKAIEKSGRNVRLMFMHHFAPGSEMKKATYRSGFHLLRMNPSNPLYWLRATIYPLLKLPRRLAYRKAYRKVYDMSDGVVLLSEGYKKDYKAIASLSDEGKFHAIPNIYDAPKADTHEKEKRVLVLSRMDEIQKRISLALKIWKKIEERPDLTEWHLDIVGSGHDAAAIRKLARRLGLKRVTFHGWQKSQPFLEKSAILMSTSDYEGLSLAMIEAQAYGCLPIAFNSYASLRDIVTDGVNGIVVENFGDTDGFADRLAGLMADEEKRREMTRNALKNAGRFASENVADKWLQMLSSRPYRH